jgi:hypothetical protein
MNNAAWSSLAALVGEPKRAWLKTNVDASGAIIGETVGFSFETGQWPGTVASATTNGVNLNYQSNSYDSATDTFHISSANATVNYSVTGTIRQSGSAFVVVAHTLCYVETNIHNAGIDIDHKAANAVDQVWQATYTTAPGRRAGVVGATMSARTKTQDASDTDGGNNIVGAAGMDMLNAAAKDSVSGFEAAIGGALSTAGNPKPLIPPGGGPGPQPHSAPQPAPSKPVPPPPPPSPPPPNVIPTTGGGNRHGRQGPK